MPIVGEKRRGSEEEDGDGVGMKGIIKQKEMAEDKGSKERKKGSDHRERERERESWIVVSERPQEEFDAVKQTGKGN